MTSHETGRPLPKFGEWDVNNPASADGFTVIFAKARDDKKANGTAASSAPPPSNEDVSKPHQSDDYPRKGSALYPPRKIGFAVSEKLVHLGAVKLGSMEWENVEFKSGQIRQRVGQ